VAHDQAPRLNVAGRWVELPEGVYLSGVAAGAVCRREPCPGLAYELLKRRSSLLIHLDTGQIAGEITAPGEAAPFDELKAALAHTLTEPATIAPSAVPVLEGEQSANDRWTEPFAAIRLLASLAPNRLPRTYDWTDVDRAAAPDESALAIDFDGDGESEYVVLARDTRDYAWALVLAFDGSRYHAAAILPLAIGGRLPSAMETPALHGPIDLDGAGGQEVVVADPWCGASTCGLSIAVLGWGDGRIVVSSGFGMGWPELTFVTEGHRTDVVLHGGTEGSVGALPNRTRIDRYRWTGRQLTLADRQWDSSPYRIHALYDALDAEADGKLDQAVAGFQRVLADDSLLAGRRFDGDQGEERRELAALARLHLALAELWRSPPDMVAAHAILTDAARLDADASIGRAAGVFLAEMDNGADPMQACQTVREVLNARPGSLDVLNDYGYSAANRTLTPSDVCPTGPRRP
jgi:hypothetical protein